MEAFTPMLLTPIESAKAGWYLGRRLERMGIFFYEELAMLSWEDLAAQRLLDERAVREVAELLAGRGLAPAERSCGFTNVCILPLETPGLEEGGAFHDACRELARMRAAAWVDGEELQRLETLALLEAGRMALCLNLPWQQTERYLHARGLWEYERLLADRVRLTQYRDAWDAFRAAAERGEVDPDSFDREFWRAPTEAERYPSAQDQADRTAFYARRRGCPFCGGVTEHVMDYDAYYCPRCDQWLGEACGDPGCEFCAERPPRPSLVGRWMTRKKES